VTFKNVKLGFALAATAALSAQISAEEPKAAAPAATAAAAHPLFTTANTTIGDILDDPAAKAIVEKHLPGFSANDNIDMARPMTMRAIQQFAADKLTDEVLNNIDADLAKLAPAK
jgi:para-nitrobenzyl esterase